MTRRAAENWERVGRAAVAKRLWGATHQTEDAIDDLVETMLWGDADPSPEQIHAARGAINELQRVFEEEVAPIAGESWAEPPHISMGDWSRAIDTERGGGR